MSIPASPLWTAERSALEVELWLRALAERSSSPKYRSWLENQRLDDVVEQLFGTSQRRGQA
jgi:hypothetical protein